MNASRTLSVTLAIVTLAVGPALAADLDTELTACRAVKADRERLACYDAIGSEPRAAATTPAPVAAAKPPAAPAPEPVTAATFGKRADDAGREKQDSMGPTDVRQLEAKVVKLRTTGDYKVEITLDNGQRWRQVSSSYLKLRVGDEIVIKRAALDSYRLVRVGNNRSMSVRRVD